MNADSAGNEPSIQSPDNTPIPTDDVEPKPATKKLPYWVTLIGVVAFVFLLLIPLSGILACGGGRARGIAMSNSCIANLKQIDGGIQQWALENHKTSTDTPAVSEITPFLKGQQLPTCPAGGTYLMHSVSENPTCNVPGHTL